MKVGECIPPDDPLLLGILEILGEYAEVSWTKLVTTLTQRGLLEPEINPHTRDGRLRRRLRGHPEISQIRQGVYTRRASQPAAPTTLPTLGIPVRPCPLCQAPAPLRVQRCPVQICGGSVLHDCDGEQLRCILCGWTYYAPAPEISPETRALLEKLRLEPEPYRGRGRPPRQLQPA